MKLQAKRLVEAMETSRDRVAVMTFPVGSSNTGPMSSSRDGVHVLNSSGSVAKQQLIDDIALLGQNKWNTDPAARNVRDAVLASVKKLKRNAPQYRAIWKSPTCAFIFVDVKTGCRRDRTPAGSVLW